jgi:hypothetical protein
MGPRRSSLCGRTLGRDVLETGDRSPEVRDEAARADIVILNKPLKPAPLRAQLTRHSAMMEAAEQGAGFAGSAPLRQGPLVFPTKLILVQDPHL